MTPAFHPVPQADPQALAWQESATIHDFIVVLPTSYHDAAGHARKLIQSELRRVGEFNDLARNRAQTYQTLRPVLTAYDLEHVL